MPVTSSSLVELTAPLTSLGIVDAEAALLSEVFGISTVFDLGSSPLFNAALELLSAANGESPLSGIGLWNRQLLKSEARTESLETVISAAATVLAGLGNDAGARIADTLELSTVEQLAQWEPFLTARNAVVSANEIDSGVPDFDPVDALRPQIGQFPVERFYYRQMILLDQHAEASGTQELNGPLQLAAAARDVERKPLVGAVVTLAQSWYAQAVTLGQLLHSLALAPGEATRIAVIDWSRRSSANTAESIAEGEELSNTQDHSRALSEVQEATATDVQEGGSSTVGRSDTESTAAAKTFSGGFLLASSSASVSTQNASTTTETNSASWSVGSRSVTGQLAQNVNDRAEQNASVVRNRRASAVREVSQSEHEQVSTRIVANYNHMHALTIQYWEVVQLYRAATELHEARRCLFVPVAPIDFDQPGGLTMIQRHRQKLAAAALTKRAFDLLTEPETLVSISAENTPINTRNVFELPDVGLIDGSILDVPGLRGELEDAGVSADIIANIGTGTTRPQTTVLWIDSEVSRFSDVTGQRVLRPGSNELFVSDEMYVGGFELVANLTGVTEIVVTKSDASVVKADVSDDQTMSSLESRTRMRDIENITIVKPGTSPTNGRIAIICTYRGRMAKLPSIPVSLTTQRTRIATFKTDREDRERDLIQHLSEHQSHYSSAILRRLTANDLVRILSEWTWNGKRLVDIVEPKPIAVTGDYLILSAPVDLEEEAGTQDNKSWGQLLEERSLLPGTNTNERLIPIPTGGVFAEAVLGRSNSAEKLDITRFWDWSESPIPLTPPEISPVTTGSRATEENLTPGQLGSPILNITTPASLPDPSGLSAVLTALTNLNFRDMSGLAGNQQLAEALSNISGEAAATAGELASRNLATEAQKQVALAQNAADLIKTGLNAFGKPTGDGGSSRAGAMINHGQSLDQRRSASGPGLVSSSENQADGAVEIPGGTGTPDETANSGNGEFTSGSNSSSAGVRSFPNETAAFQNALHGPLGESGVNTIERALEYQEISSGSTQATTLLAGLDGAPLTDETPLPRLPEDEGQELLVLYHPNFEEFRRRVFETPTREGGVSIGARMTYRSDAGTYAFALADEAGLRYLHSELLGADEDSPVEVLFALLRDSSLNVRRIVFDAPGLMIVEEPILVPGSPTDEIARRQQFEGEYRDFFDALRAAISVLPLESFPIASRESIVEEITAMVELIVRLETDAYELTYVRLTFINAFLDFWDSDTRRRYISQGDWPPGPQVLLIVVDLYRGWKSIPDTTNLAGRLVDHWELIGRGINRVFYKKSGVGAPGYEADIYQRQLYSWFDTIHEDTRSIYSSFSSRFE